MHRGVSRLLTHACKRVFLHHAYMPENKGNEIPHPRQFKLPDSICGKSQFTLHIGKDDPMKAHTNTFRRESIHSDHPAQTSCRINSHISTPTVEKMVGPKQFLTTGGCRNAAAGGSKEIPFHHHEQLDSAQN